MCHLKFVYKAPSLTALLNLYLLFTSNLTIPVSVHRIYRVVNRVDWNTKPHILASGSRHSGHASPNMCPNHVIPTTRPQQKMLNRQEAREIGMSPNMAIEDPVTARQNQQNDFESIAKEEPTVYEVGDDV